MSERAQLDLPGAEAPVEATASAGAVAVVLLAWRAGMVTGGDLLEALKAAKLRAPTAVRDAMVEALTADDAREQGWADVADRERELRDELLAACEALGTQPARVGAMREARGLLAQERP